MASALHKIKTINKRKTQNLRKNLKKEKIRIKARKIRSNPS